MTYFHSRLEAVCMRAFLFCMTALACSLCIFSARARFCFSASLAIRSASFLSFLGSNSCGGGISIDRLSALEERLSDGVEFEDAMFSSTGGS